MRKLLFPLLSILLFTACQKQITEEIEKNATEEISSAAAEGGNNTIDVCHREGNGSYHTINISVNALPAHLAHGDIVPDADGDGYTKVNPCSNGSQDDCNDNDAAIYPGSTEICGNNIDDNCNGQIDENCIASVTICNQVWMLKNLDVTTYRDGTPIPEVTDPTAWTSLTTGAWCYNANISANGTTYGKLYNWYAVAGIHDNDPNTPNKVLAPTSWHVPSDAEWTTLGNCLDAILPTGNVGGKMKTTGTNFEGNGLWNNPNTNATNSSGFTGLPGGYRILNGSFTSNGIQSIWWSSSESSTNFAWLRFLIFNNGNLSRINFNKLAGFYVRCLRD